MSDLFRDLPLSSRAHADESAVTGDWRGALAEVVRQAEALLARLPEGERERRARAFLVRASLAREARSDALAGLPEAIGAGRKRGVRALSRATCALLELARDVGGTITLAPLTAGAVALYRATSGPLEIRAVVSGHTLRSTDDGWEFGRGPVLQDTSQRLVAFLCGVSNEAPRRAPARR